MYSELFTDALSEGDLISMTGFVRDFGEEKAGSWFVPPRTRMQIIQMTFLELCSYDFQGTVAVPAPFAVPAETCELGSELNLCGVAAHVCVALHS